MGPQLHTTALLVISLSMAATPFLVRLGDRLRRRRVQAPRRHRIRSSCRRLRRHVIVAGYGRVGQAIAEMLEETGHPVRRPRAGSAPGAAGPARAPTVFYGDGSDPQVLRSVAAEQAAALVITLDRPAAAERLVAVARQLYPGRSPSSPAAMTGRTAPGCARSAPPSSCPRRWSSA